MKSIFNRRSVRRFTDQAVEAEKLDRLLRAAMQAPSAGNQMPWEFIVFRDRDNIEALSHTTPYTKLTAGANLAILFLARREGLRFPLFSDQDMAACVQNLMLEATHLELGTCWMGIPSDKPEVLEKLHKDYGIPRSHTPFALIAVGYPKEGHENRCVDRYDASRIHNEKFAAN